MEPSSHKPVTTGTCCPSSPQSPAETDSDKKVETQHTTTSYMPVPGTGETSPPRQRLLEQINDAHTTSPTQTVAYSAKLNALLLAEGITGDERLVNIERSGAPLPSVGQKNITIPLEEDDDFFDALAEPYNVQQSSPKQTESYARQLYSAAKSAVGTAVTGTAKFLTQAPAIYIAILNKAASKIASKGLKGIEGHDINQLMISMNEAHTQNKPQTIHLNKLTFLKLDPSYNLTNATVTLHEVSTTDPTKGYHQVRVKVSITADAEYPSPDGGMVRGRIEINEAQLDLNFEHEQVIRKLLTSANVVTTAAQLFGSLAYSKLPGVPGWQRVKNMAGWGQDPQAPVSSPSLKSLLMPTALKMKNADIHMALQSKDHPGLQAQFNLKNGEIAYNFTEKLGYLTCKNSQLSLSGEQCAKLMPFTLKKNLEENFPFFKHDHTSLEVTIPDLVLKNEKDNLVVVIPEAAVESKGDLNIHNGRIEDLRVGVFKQPTGSLIASVKAKKLSANHAMVPACSLKLPFEESGKVSVKDANLTFIHSPVSTKTSAAKLIKKEGQSLYQRLKGWVGLNTAPNKLPARSDKNDDANKLLTFSAASVEADIHGDINFNGELKDFGLMFDSQAEKLHLDVSQLATEKTSLGKSPEPVSETDEVKVPLTLEGTANDIHLVMPTKRQPDEAMTDIEIGVTHLNMSGPISTQDTRLENLKLTVLRPNEQEFHIMAKGREVHSGTTSIKALKGDGDFEMQEVKIESHMHQRPSTQAEKDAVENFWQKPATKIRQVTADIKTEAVSGQLTPESSTVAGDVKRSRPEPVFETLQIKSPEIHVDMSEPEGEEGLGTPKLITGYVNTSEISANGHPELKQLSENDQHIIEVCQKVSEEMPELKEAMEDKLKKYNLRPESERQDYHPTTHLKIATPSASFSKQGSVVSAQATVPEVALSVNEGPVNLSAQITGIEGSYNSTEGTSKLAIKKVAVGEVSKTGSVTLLPAEGKTTVAEIETITLLQKKTSEESKSTELHIGDIHAETRIEHLGTKTTVPLKLEVHNADVTKSDHPRGSDIHVNIVKTKVATHGRSGDDHIDANLDLETVSVAANFRVKDNKLSTNIGKTNFHSNGIVNTDISLKNIGVAVEQTPSGVKICTHIDSEQSGIHFDNLAPLKRLEGAGSALPVKFSLTPHLDQGDELTGTISAECTGNLGEACGYAAPLVKGRKSRLLFSVLKHVCKAMDFKVSVERVPINKGNINVGALMKHIHIDVSFKGKLSWLFRPVLAIAQSVTGYTMRKRFSSMSNSGVVDTQGYVSLTQLLAKNNIHIVTQETMQPVAIPMTTSQVRTALNHLHLHQPLPMDWDEESFRAGIITELEKIYGEDTTLEEDFKSLAAQFVKKHGYPKTVEEFDLVMEDLKLLERYKQSHPDIHGPMGNFRSKKASPFSNLRRQRPLKTHR